MGPPEESQKGSWGTPKGWERVVGGEAACGLSSAPATVMLCGDGSRLDGRGLGAGGGHQGLETRGGSDHPHAGGQWRGAPGSLSLETGLRPGGGVGG